MSTYDTPTQESSGSIDAVDHLDFSPTTGKRAVYEAFRFDRAGDLVRVWNDSHGAHVAEEHVYAVGLDDRDVPVRCSCPAFEYHCGPGEMCKHGVAVALHLPEIEDQAVVATDGGVTETTGSTDDQDDDQPGERVRVPVSGAILVYSRRKVGKELVGFEEVTDWGDLADALAARGHNRGDVYHLPVFDE